MDKNSILARIKDHEAYLDVVDPVLLEADQMVMCQMIREINSTCHPTSMIRGFSDICDTYVKGAGEIVSKYIERFRSHSTRASLLFHLIGNRKYSCRRVDNCESIVWNLYKEYRLSSEYVNNIIQLEFDAAFAQMKSKALLDELLSIAQDPIDFCYLPKTMKMLGRWKCPEFGSVVKYYFENFNLVKEQLSNSQRFAGCCDNDLIHKILNKWESVGFYTVVICLRSFPSPEIIPMLIEWETRIEAKMQKELLDSKERNERIRIKDIYSDRLFSIRKTLAYVDKMIK